MPGVFVQTIWFRHTCGQWVSTWPASHKSPCIQIFKLVSPGRNNANMFLHFHCWRKCTWHDPIRQEEREHRDPMYDLLQPPSDILVGSQTLATSWVECETGPGTQRAGTDWRKRQTPPNGWVAGLTRKETCIWGLSWAATRWVGLHTCLPESYKFI